jgi:hypothetical protein
MVMTNTKTTAAERPAVGDIVRRTDLMTIEPVIKRPQVIAHAERNRCDLRLYGRVPIARSATVALIADADRRRVDGGLSLDAG